MPGVPNFLLPQFIRDLPMPMRVALLLPGLLVGGILGIVVNAIAVNLGAGNQHLSTANGGFDQWLIWIIVAVGTLGGIGLGAFIYIGVGRSGVEEEEAPPGETGMLDV